MRITEKELILSYFNAQITELEDTVNKLQSRVRFRKIDVSDTYELQYALIRLEQMKQVCADITTFLRLGGDSI